jgi:hypothetical protein
MGDTPCLPGPPPSRSGGMVSDIYSEELLCDTVQQEGGRPNVCHCLTFMLQDNGSRRSSIVHNTVSSDRIIL